MSQDTKFLKSLNISSSEKGGYDGSKWFASGETFPCVSPHDNKEFTKVQHCTLEDYELCVKNMQGAWRTWASLPAPKRGDIVRQLGEALRANLKDLGAVISLEMGKIAGEGIGEVQETIDICDFACGLSRAINGQVIPSERNEHFMMEQWNPLGLVGVITAFNFPNAVFGWNLALALICGNCVMWKCAPSAAALTIATMKIFNSVFEKNDLPKGIVTCCVGGADIGQAIAKDKRMNLVSFTGSTKVGRLVQREVVDRFGKCLLELGGNNAQIIMPDASLELAIKGAIFGAVGTCGQRCTTLRRLYVQESIYEEVRDKIAKVYPTVAIGDPLKDTTLCGPLHSKWQVEMFLKGIEDIKQQGGKVLCGGQTVDGPGNYVKPCLVEIDANAAILKEELFCPILYIIKFKTLDEAIQYNNDVPQGLSSSLFTTDLRNMHKWMGPLGSDCGIVNCNIGTSGAEIGGAFGGEKETGGGRESGSDSWKQYMRRSTCTINYGHSLPLAQGIKFDV